MYACGCTAVGVDEICRPAGVHKGSFYHFFPSKQALVLAVLDMYGQHIRDLWEAGRRADCPLRSASSGRVHMPIVCTVRGYPEIGLGKTPDLLDS